MNTARTESVSPSSTPTEDRKFTWRRVASRAVVGPTTRECRRASAGDGASVVRIGDLHWIEGERVRRVLLIRRSWVRRMRD